MISVTVPKMSCGGCAQAITRAILAADPAARVEIDLPAKRVSADSSLPEARIRQLLGAAGYPVAPG